MNKDLDEIQRLVQSFFDSEQPKRAIELLENIVRKNPNFVEAWMLLGSVYRALGQTSKVIEVCKKSLDYSPNDPRIWVNLGINYVENNQYEQAFEPLKKALSLDSANPSAWYSLGMALLAKKECDQAIEAFQKTVKLDPNRVNAWIVLASTLDDTKQFTQAIAAYKKALELQPSLFEALTGLGMTYVNKGDYIKAIDFYEKSLKINPNEAAIWFHLGTTLSKANKLDRAIDAIKEGLRIDPTIVNAWMDLKDVYDKKGDKEGASWASRKAVATGKVDVKFTNSDDPKEIMEMITNRQNNESDKVDEEVNELFRKAKELMRLAKSPKARKILNKILKKDPNNIDALVLKAKTIGWDRQYRDKAAKIVAKALKLDPNNVEALIYLAKLTMKGRDRRRNMRALELVNMAIEVEPRSEDAWLLKGLIYSWLDDKENTARCYKKALRINPNNSRARNNIERYITLEEKVALFKEIDQKSDIDRDSDNVKTLIYLAELKLYSKDRRRNMKALELINIAIEAEPRSEDAWSLKGLIYSRLKDKENTARCYEKALRINPNNSRARNNIEKYITLEEKVALFKEIDQKSDIDRVRILNFNNPKIRKEKFAKQLGFDPIAFKPLTEDNMVYVHMDGNEKNDDPNTHAWVSKETYEMLKSGTALKGQKSEIGKQRALIEQHLETYLGGVNKILHDQRKDRYHIDIYVLPPNDKRNYGVMVTSGMSDYAMNGPPKLKFFQYGELYIKLPSDWPYPMEELKQDDYAWVFQNLYLLPRSVHENRTFFWNGQVIDNDEAFARNTELSGFLIKYPNTIDIPVEFNMLKVNPQKAICFYQLIPLYDKEMDFLEKRGLEKLYEKFDEYGITDIVDLKRPKVC
jgi:tetratricopeptide (TPR) repeat protein